MLHRQPSILTLFVLYAISFIDLAGLAIVYVIFGPLIIDSSSSVVASGMTKAERNVIVGLLIAAYPLTQFFGAPILGALSDKYGRKRPLFISTAFSGFAFFLSSFSLYINNLPLLFISRFLAGFSAGNLTIAMAATSDLIEEEKRPRYMSAFTILGGGVLDDRSIFWQRPFRSAYCQLVFLCNSFFGGGNFVFILRVTAYCSKI